MDGQRADEKDSQYGQVMGLSHDLHLRGNDFSNAASAFFIADLVAVVPNSTLPHPQSTTHSR